MCNFLFLLSCKDRTLFSRTHPSILKWRQVYTMSTCMQVHAHKHFLVDWLRTAPIYPITLSYDCCEAQPNSISNGRPVSGTPCHDVCFMINIEARQLLHCHIASSSCGPRVKQHGESWDVITQSVCAILIKTLLTVLHYWNTPHRTLLNSLNKLAPAPLIIHRMMSTFFLPRRG